jgi:transposase
MPKGKSDKLTFKPYDQGQGELIPPTAEELIAPDHLVRIVSETLDKIDITILLKQYKKGGGASRYNPLMLLKVLIYGYLNNVFSSRQIAKQVRENIYMRWIAGCQQPDFRTINSFRKEKLSPIIEEIFVEVVRYLKKSGHIELETVYIDGTKIESRANRYTFVWKKAVKNYDEKLEEKVRDLYRQASAIAEQENLEYGDTDLTELGNGPIDSESIERVAENINKALEKFRDDDEKEKEVKKN